MKTCIINSSNCSDKKAKCICTWQYSYNPQLHYWNNSWASYMVYFEGLGECVEDVFNNTRTGGWKAAIENVYIEQSLVKVWFGEEYNTDCYTHPGYDGDFEAMSQDLETLAESIGYEQKFVTYYYTPEERERLFKNNCCFLKKENIMTPASALQVTIQSLIITFLLAMNTRILNDINNKVNSFTNEIQLIKTELAKVQVCK